MTYYQKRNPLWMLIASVLLIPLFCLPPQEAASEKIVLKDTWVVNASDAPMASSVSKRVSSRPRELTLRWRQGGAPETT